MAVSCVTLLSLSFEIIQIIKILSLIKSIYARGYILRSEKKYNFIYYILSIFNKDPNEIFDETLLREKKQHNM